MKNTVFAGVDPGQKGAVAFIDGDSIEVYDPPMISIKKNGKNKKDYDIAAMAAILRKYENRHVIFYIEAVFSMKGQGVSSTFNFGRGKGIWEGMAYAFNFEVKMISPQTWKKKWPELKSSFIPSKSKTIRKEIEKQKRISKAASKAEARKLASNLYPSVKDRLKTVNSDGRAEAILIAHYAKDANSN